MQPPYAGKENFTFWAWWPGQRRAKFDVKWVPNDLCIGDCASDLLFGQLQICFGNEIASKRRWQGISISSRIIICGPPSS